jgi:hypothetical protein
MEILVSHGAAAWNVVKVFNFDQRSALAPSSIPANQPALPTLEENMDRHTELIQRLLEIQSGARPRSPKLIEEDERLMHGLRKRILAAKPIQNVSVGPKRFRTMLTR